MSYWRVVCFAGGHEQQSHALHTYKRHLEKLAYQHLSADCKGLIAGKYYLPEKGDFRADNAILSILSPTASQKSTLVYWLRWCTLLWQSNRKLVEARRDSLKMS